MHMGPKVQLGNEIRVISVTVKHIMLRTSWSVYVPERLSYQVFHLAIFVLPLIAD